MKSAVAHFVDGRLFSPKFNDYYAARDPVAETAHVHIHPASLVVRMSQANTFTVFEFGFGAGINFLSTSTEFLKHAKPNARLRFISCEAFPLQHDTFRQVLERTSIDTSLSRRLLDFYPPLVSGIYRQLFANDQVELTLIFADIETALIEFVDQDSVGVDSWMLDGFAPARNPQMWDAKLIPILAQSTKTNGTVTSFSSAGSVRRSLEDNGFRVQKIEGTPFKRHTLLATLSESRIQSTEPPRKVTIVGGGFAGTATARAFARRGVHVQLLTPSGSVGDATSSIPTAVLHPRLSASMEAPAYFRTQTYFYAVALLSQHLQPTSIGALQITGKNMEAKRLKEISNMLGENWASWIDSAEFCELTNTKNVCASTYFPKSIVVNGVEMCRSLADHPCIEIVAKKHSAPIDDELTIYATGSASVLGKLAEAWEVLTIEGQIDTFAHSNINAIPRKVLIQDGYIVPLESTCIVGSTYEYTRWEPELATKTNLAKLQQVTRREHWTHVEKFRGLRTVTSDKLPIVGQIDRNQWVNLAHGSAGTASTPFCAEILASQVFGELAPAWQECLSIINPDRFSERQIRRPNPFLRHKR